MKALMIIIASLGIALATPALAQRTTPAGGNNPLGSGGIDVGNGGRPTTDTGIWVVNRPSVPMPSNDLTPGSLTGLNSTGLTPTGRIPGAPVMAVSNVAVGGVVCRMYRPFVVTASGQEIVDRTQPVRRVCERPAY